MSAQAAGQIYNKSLRREPFLNRSFLKRVMFAVATLSFIYSGLELARYIHAYIELTGSFYGPSPLTVFPVDLRIEFAWVLVGPLVYLASILHEHLWRLK